MPRVPSKIRQSDMTRALKAARAAGVDIAKIEIDGEGKIAFFVATDKDVEPASELDQWINDHAGEA